MFSLRALPSAAFSLSLSLLASPALAQRAPHRGDLDGDWRLNVSDAYAIWQHLDGRFLLDPDALARADANRDGVVDALDVEALSIPEPCTPIFDEGLPQSFPAVCAIEPESAAVGDDVVLFVRGLSAAPPGPRVFFGEIEASAIPVGAHRVVATVPEGAETAPVTLVVAGVRSLGRPFEVRAPLDRAYTIVPPAPASSRSACRASARGTTTPRLRAARGHRSVRAGRVHDVDGVRPASAARRLGRARHRAVLVARRPVHRQPDRARHVGGP